MKQYEPILMAEAWIEWHSAPHGAKGYIISKYADIFGISKQQISRILKDFNNFRPYMEAAHGK